jgi:hypothetical protein
MSSGTGLQVSTLRATALIYRLIGLLLGRAPPSGSAIDRYAQHEQEEEDGECSLKHPAHLATRRPCSICRMSRLQALHIQAVRRTGPQSSRCNHAAWWQMSQGPMGKTCLLTLLLTLHSCH